ncbi:transcription factor BIM2-like isoform X2 [Curcuma longa]|uniref:transcription factor BIM2-like isoform X2 n=1 Tax=Curcuma longa TaxID=136217 RepID=UPI003D9EF97B
MEATASRSRKGFEDEDEESSEFGRREGSSHRDLTIKVDGKGSGTDDLPTSPRSKHSAMEQRRRNKINDRFQILSDLIPHSDQKRDKASFLLEVIEYIRFLQEKVQKYESSVPGWNQENPKLMPWVKVYFRSFWKNAENNNQIPIEGLPDPSQVIRSGSTHEFSGHFDEGDIPVTPALIPNAQNQIESDTTGGAQYKMDNATGFVPNMPAQAQSLWFGSSSPADCAASNEMLNDQDELIIDEGTINASANYSQGLLTTLSQALQSSGMDLSQASISVQINLRKRASNKRSDTAATLSNSKCPDDTAPAKQAVASAPSAAGNISEESSQASKRLKAARNS